MKTKIKEVYYCEFCKKHGLLKHAMIRHESMCWGNPETDRPCFDCQNMTKSTTEIFSDDGNGNGYVEVFYCKAKDTFLYTPKNEVKKNWFDLGNERNSPMPKQCDLQDKKPSLNLRSTDY
jgi:hypothetical protein